MGKVKSFIKRHPIASAYAVFPAFEASIVGHTIAEPRSGHLAIQIPCLVITVGMNAFVAAAENRRHRSHGLR